jgi:predicted lipoprotein
MTSRNSTSLHVFFRVFHFCVDRVNLRQLLAVGLLVFFLLTVAGCKEGDYFFFYAVEEEEKVDEGEDRLEYFKDEKFDADKIVEDIWESKVMPAITEEAIDLTVLLDAFAADPEAAGEQYGHREEGGDYPWNFIVKAEARVVAINTRSRKGTLSIDVDPYDGEADATIWIGPIITSYSIRDSLDFISFTTGTTGASSVNYQFDTQVQFAELSNSLNRRGNQNILVVLEPKMCYTLSDYSLEKLKGKEVPEDILNTLSGLNEGTCTSKDQFWEAVQDLIGEKAEEYQELIWKYADTNDTLKGKSIRVYGAITQERSGEIIITPVQLEILEEGHS